MRGIAARGRRWCSRPFAPRYSRDSGPEMLGPGRGAARWAKFGAGSRGDRREHGASGLRKGHLRRCRTLHKHSRSRFGGKQPGAVQKVLNLGYIAPPYSVDMLSGGSHTLSSMGGRLAVAFLNVPASVDWNRERGRVPGRLRSLTRDILVEKLIMMTLDSPLALEKHKALTLLPTVSLTVHPNRVMPGRMKREKCWNQLKLAVFA
jgi:hypothetical protein